MILEIIAISAAISAITTGINVAVAKHQTDKAKEANNKQMARQERHAKASNLRQYNQAVRAMGTGYAVAKKEILESTREAAAADRAERYDYGKPETRA